MTSGNGKNGEIQIKRTLSFDEKKRLVTLRNMLLKSMQNIVDTFLHNIGESSSKADIEQTINEISQITGEEINIIFEKTKFKISKSNIKINKEEIVKFLSGFKTLDELLSKITHKSVHNIGQKEISNRINKLFKQVKLLNKKGKDIPLQEGELGEMEDAQIFLDNINFFLIDNLPPDTKAAITANDELFIKDLIETTLFELLTKNPEISENLQIMLNKLVDYLYKHHKQTINIDKLKQDISQIFGITL